MQRRTSKEIPITSAKPKSATEIFCEFVVFLYVSNKKLLSVHHHKVLGLCRRRSVILKKFLAGHAHELEGKSARVIGGVRLRILVPAGESHPGLIWMVLRSRVREDSVANSRIEVIEHRERCLD